MRFDPEEDDDEQAAKPECGAWLKRCKRCKRKYTKEDTAQGIVACPDCQTPRERCTTSPMENGKCRMHGGKSPKGVNSPNFQHGRRSRYHKTLPAVYRPDYLADLKDPEQLSLRDEIATVTSRIKELQRRDARNESATAWINLRGLFDQYEEVRVKLADDPDDRDARGDEQYLFDELKGIIEGGGKDEQTWRDIERLMDLRRKLSHRESRRIIEQNQAISVDQAFALVSGIVDIVRRAVNSNVLEQLLVAKILSTIAEDIDRFIAESRGEAPATGRNGGERLLVATGASSDAPAMRAE